MHKISILFLLLLSAVNILFAQSVRTVKDSVGFCWNPYEMNRFIKFLEDRNKESLNNVQPMIGAISVHDDYLYAGDVYFQLFNKIKAKEVVIFGVTHSSVKKEVGLFQNVIVLDEFNEWRGVYSNVGVSPLREEIKKGLNPKDFIVNNKAHSIEHSIEALIPFLQYYNRDIKITPVMIPQINLETMKLISGNLSEIITSYMKRNNLVPGKDILFIISNDANHYGEDFKNFPYGLDLAAHSKATENDKRILRQNFECGITDKTISDIAGELIPASDNSKTIPLWCGRYPITFGLMTIKKVVEQVEGKEIEGKLFKYSDTLTEKVLPFENTSMGLTAVFSPKHWCGWFTLGLYLK